MDEKKDDDEEENNAGFEIRIPGFHAWGGREQLNKILPFLIWIGIGVFIVWGLKELIGLGK